MDRVKVSRKESKGRVRKETLSITPENKELGIYNTIWEAKNYKD